MASVSIRGVSKHFAGVQAMDSIDLQIPSGCFLTLLGPSGCGKTTTLRCIAGLVEPDRGNILIDQRDVTRVPIHERKLGMVFQSHALFPHMTVQDNVGFGLRMRGMGQRERMDRARAALEMVGLAQMTQRYPHQLSGGQQQRVAIARALVIDPAVLLLDEPFGALDRKLRETMQHELRALTRRLGITAIFVTHDQEEALVLSDQIAVMNAGRIEQIAAPNGIFERPATRFVADFMGVQNFFRARVFHHAPGLHSPGLMVFGQPIAWPDAQRLPDGSECEFGIRPEAIQIDLPDAPGAINVVVDDSVYVGTFVRQRVRHLESGHCFFLSVSSAPRDAPRPVGERLSLRLPAESLIALPEVQRAR
jgi:ABC-type Fe3+/spermidine/putrescine transport system ATPase subunit